MTFINDDFLLKTKTARILYHDYAEKMPIIDYHCHISPKEIAEDRRFDNITQVWLGGDHYKWRLMRSNGIDEKYITGDADDYSKFEKFAEMMPKAIGNPMYHWCHLELKRYFGFDGVISKETAKEIWNLCSKKLSERNFSVRNLIKKSKVKFIGTTDDPVDSLEWHKVIAKDNSFDTVVIPSFRPDKAININKAGFCDYIAKLSEVSGTEINTFDSLVEALSSRLDFFIGYGCKATDHGLDYLVFTPVTDAEANRTLKKALEGKELTSEETEGFKTALLIKLAEMYAKRDIVMQLHFNVQRSVNSVMLEKLGPDTGFDCIRSFDCSMWLSGLLNELYKSNSLPRTVLYSLNPNDNEIISSIMGSFQGTGAEGKIQHGSAWWFNDSISGMEAQMKSLANLSLLGNFIGMLTDSRSFLSYTRHEYFRRILCNMIGEWVEDGLYPPDLNTLGKIIQDICYNNAFKYFKY